MNDAAHPAPAPQANTASLLKGAGYLTSAISVILLGVVSVNAALESPWMLACLIAGMASSVAGMFLRWRSHRLEQKQDGKP